MQRRRRFRRRVARGAAGLAALVFCLGPTCNDTAFSFIRPLPGQLSLPGTVAVDLRVPSGADPGTLVVLVDGSPVAVGSQQVIGRRISGTISLPAEGDHALEARIDTTGGTRVAFGDIAITDLQDPDECEILNDAECLLPYPSSRFQVPAATPTGVRLAIPQAGMPVLIGAPLLPDPLNALDGFSPTVQILMHFPAGVDLALSDASRLLAPGCCGQVDATPYVDVRTYDDRSLDPDSPSVLIDAESGERILHFLELDARAVGNPARQALFLRPAVSLAPGHRYIVAVRDLLDPVGAPVQPERAFRALRDGDPTDIPSLEARRAQFEDIFARLEDAGVARGDLILAFDFTVQSEQQLTGDMLAIRSAALAVNPASIAITMDAAFNAANHHPDCQTTGEKFWRRVKGTFAAPYFLSAPLDDILSIATLVRDGNGNPVQNTGALATQPVPMDFAIPCSVLDGVTPVRPLLLGHGLFGTGSGMVDSVLETADRIEQLGLGGFDYIAGATDWRGLSFLDQPFLAINVIGLGNHMLNNFPAFVDRLKQGMANTLVLARLMKEGHLNARSEFQTTPGNPATGVFPGAGEEMFYLGVSLGGIMGTFLAALTPHVERFNLDVGAINFSLLLQRSTQFSDFEDRLANVGLTDPMETALGLGLLHEQWVSSEPAGYARHVTGLVEPPLPNTNAKKILMTVAWLDKQVSNQASEIAARTLGIPNLEGSLVAGLQGVPDVVAGPSGVDSALVVYDTGSFDVFDPAFDPYVPPLSNTIPSPVCDPHGRRLSIPASLEQLLDFLQPGGTIRNFCTDDGVCNASDAAELPEDVCDPLP